jgi:hypothetical protein
MPLGRYDKLFGGEQGAADKVLANMKRTYGRAKGEQVFRATIIKRERKQNARPRRRKR